MTKRITLGEIFTADELKRAEKLYKECNGIVFNKRCTAEIVAPVLARINQVTGQENDANYWAYGIEYALMKGGA